MGFPERGPQIREEWENKPFLALNVNISKTLEDTAKVTVNH